MGWKHIWLEKRSIACYAAACTRTQRAAEQATPALSPARRKRGMAPKATQGGFRNTALTGDASAVVSFSGRAISS